MSLSIPGVVCLDLDISEDQLEAGARKVIKAVKPEWPIDDVVFKMYTDGITNKLIGCRLKTDTEYDDSILVRIYGAKTDVIIDREIEMISMYILNQAGCSKPLLCQFNNGISYGFIAGKCLDAESVRDEHIGSLVAKEMVRVGAIDPLQYADGLPQELVQRFVGGKQPSLFKKLRKFLAAAPTSFPEPDRNERLQKDFKSLAELNAEADMLEKELTNLGSPVVLCHNDILLNNIVHNKKDDRCYIIDFEYAAYNYQAFDIGDHFTEWAGVDEVDYNLYPDKPTQLVWLRHFLTAYKAQQGHESTAPSDTELERLYVQVNKFSLAAHFFWGVWALIQAEHSTIDFDYLEYGKIRFDEYFRRKEEFLSLRLP